MRNVCAHVLPTSLDDALEIVQRSPRATAYLAGGTALAERDDPSLETLVDLSQLGLDRIETSALELRIGAMVGLEAARNSAPVSSLGDGLLSQAIHSTRTQIWRNQATLGGRIMEADPGDLVLPALMVLGASLRVLRAPRSQEESIPSEDIGALALGDLLLGITIPMLPGWRHAGEWMRISALDRPVAACFVALHTAGGRIDAARVACSGLGPRAFRARSVESELCRKSVALESFERFQDALQEDLRASDDVRATQAYRTHLGRVLLGRALRRAANVQS